MTKKPRSLVAELAGRETPGSRRWWEKMPADELETLVDAVQAWRRWDSEDGKRLRQFFKTRHALYRYLSGQHEVECEPPAITVGPTAFWRFLEFLERHDAN